MSQHGGATTIGPEVRLLLLDCFETLVELHGTEYRPRLGIPDFLTHFGARVGIPIVVISDAKLSEINSALTQAGLSRYVVTVYHADNASEALGGGRARKRLDVPVNDFQVAPHEALFIGDSPLDSQAAQHYGVPFIRVPRSEDRTFNFATLITGPSRYRSQEFDATFVDRYTNKGRKDWNL